LNAVGTVGARAMAHDLNRRIVKDNDGLPHFAQASQNIAAAMAFAPRAHNAHNTRRPLGPS
jgi:hypothetical protein